MKEKVFISLISGILIFASGNSAYAQLKQKKEQLGEKVAESSDLKFNPSRVTFGGNFGMSFGSHTSMIQIAPQVGYFFTPKLNAGAGISYTYYKYKYDNLDLNTKYHYIGLNVFGRYYPIQYLVIHLQPEMNYMIKKSGDIRDSKFVPSLVVGAGLHYNGISFMLEYDIVQDKYSPYGNNIFYGVGFSF